MSFDPFGQNVQAEPPTPAPPAGPGYQIGEDQFEPARDRVRWAAMFLIASSTINLLVALFQTGIFIVVIITPADALHRLTMNQINQVVSEWPQMADSMRKTQEQVEQTEPGQFKTQRMMQEGAVAGLFLLVAALGLAGGWRMYQLKSYSLAMLGSLASAVPCLSPMSCCCGVGMMIGGWCVMVLLMPDVREVFRT